MTPHFIVFMHGVLKSALSDRNLRPTSLGGDVRSTEKSSANADMRPGVLLVVRLTFPGVLNPKSAA